MIITLFNVSVNIVLCADKRLHKAIQITLWAPMLLAAGHVGKLACTELFAYEHSELSYIIEKLYVI